MVSETKNPVFVESGKVGARRRWGPPRVLRLDQLTDNQRRLITAVLAATEAAATEDQTPVAANVEVRRGDVGSAQ